jgi:hypothetical protein
MSAASMLWSSGRHAPSLRLMSRYPGGIEELDLKATVAKVLDRWPCAGLPVGVIRMVHWSGSWATVSPRSRTRSR